MGKYKKDYSRKGKSFSGHRDFSNDRVDTKGYSERHAEQDMSEQGKD